MRDDELIQDVEDADMAEFPAAVKEAVSEAKVRHGTIPPNNLT